MALIKRMIIISSVAKSRLIIAYNGGMMRFCLLAFALFNPLMPVFAQSGDPIISAMQNASNKTNQSLPHMLDRETRADTTWIGPGRVWTYALTAMNLTSKDITEAELRNIYGNTVLNGVCTAPFMKIFLQNKVKVVYLYRGYDGSYIGTITVNPEQCR